MIAIVKHKVLVIKWNALSHNGFPELEIGWVGGEDHIFAIKGGKIGVLTLPFSQKMR